VLTFLSCLIFAKNNTKRSIHKIRVMLICVLLFIDILFIISCNRSPEKISKIRISRYRVELQKTEMDCLFRHLFKYLPDEEQGSYYNQKGQSKYLDEIDNLSNVYLLIFNKKEFYIDFILLSNKDNPRTFYLKIAGERGFVDPFVKGISDRCKIDRIERIEGSDKDLIKWGTN
jgi:hypothetical protein